MAAVPFDRAAMRAFCISLGAVLVVLLVGFAVVVRYPEAQPQQNVAQYWGFLRDVNVMIFVGFGFLMTFLRRYSFSAVALNLVLACVAVVEFALVGGAVQQMMAESPAPSYVRLGLPLLIDSSFCAAAAMIAFGAVLGKASPSQLLWLVVMLVPVYALNQHLVFDVLRALDCGGSISIHAFGAYYGLAASLVLSHPSSGAGHKKNGPSYFSDITSMVGTLFLWIMWPSFNAALVSQPSEFGSGGDSNAADAPPAQQYYCIANTLLSLLGATAAVFLASPLLLGQLEMMHVQNATLAGGVAAGAAANMVIEPAGALGLGLAAGLLSTVGFVHIQPSLERRIGLKDTCGVHNLHGMPGVLGGLAAGFAALALPSANAALLFHGSGPEQMTRQLAAIGSTVGIACCAGLLAGLLVTKVALLTGPPFPEEALFEDAALWHGIKAEVDRSSRPGDRSTRADRSSRGAVPLALLDRSGRPPAGTDGSVRSGAAAPAPVVILINEVNV